MAVLGHARALVCALGITGSLLLAGCGGGTAGGAAGKAAAAGGTAVGNDVLVKTLKYGDAAFGTPGTATATPGMGGGYTLDPSDPATPNGGKAGQIKFADNGTSVPFWFPGTTGNTGIMINAGGTGGFTVPPGKYKAMNVLTSGVYGAGVADVTFTYSGGTGTAQFTSDDWCNGSPTDGVVAWMAQTRLSPDGSQDGNACGMDVDTVAVDGTKTLQSVKVDSDPANGAQNVIVIMAVTLTKA